MNNSTLSSTEKVLSVDELMNGLGLKSWLVILNQFIAQIINISSIATCSLSAWIFIKHISKFSDPIFFYYRLLTLTYIACSLVILPNLVCYSPRFFPV